LNILLVSLGITLMWLAYGTSMKLKPGTYGAVAFISYVLLFKAFPMFLGIYLTLWGLT
jgi:hypothetical protein